MNLDWQHMPDREWLINNLYTLKTDHKFFKYGKANDEKEQKQEDVIKR